MGINADRGRVFGVVALACLLQTACAPDSSPAGPNALSPGATLGRGVILAGAHTYAVEPMSPTSGRCALRLEHRASSTWTEVFPVPGWERPARFDSGDLHYADGRQRMKPPGSLATVYDAAKVDLRRRLRGLTGNQLAVLCTARDRQLPSSGRFWLPGALALLLLMAAALAHGRSAAGSLALALGGLCCLLATASPVLYGESFGSQELQRLMTSLQPWGALLRGDHGDARHPAGLFLAYAPAARLGGTILGLRIFGFALLAVTLGVWVVLRWRKDPGEALVGLALLAHPILLKNSLEVGPYAFYTAGMLLLFLAVGGRTEMSRLRFGVGLGLGLFLAATNHVATVLGAAVLILAVIRSRGAISRLELWARLAAVVLVVLPFLILLGSALGGESGLRQAAERTPELAWGSRSFWLLATGLTRSVFVGWLVVVLGVLVPVLGYKGRRSHVDGLVLVGLGLLTLVALAVLAPWLRVQPYYALYGLVPVLCGFGRLLGAAQPKAARLALGLLCVGVLTLELVRMGPALARPVASPRPAVAAARAAQQRARSCPMLLSATNDLVLPLVPHLIDVRQAGRTRPAPRLGGTSQAVAWDLPGSGLTLISLYARHRLPADHLDRLVARLSELSRRACVQVLYDRRFPLPRLYRLLLERCVTSLDRGPYRLFACGPVAPSAG